MGSVPVAEMTDEDIMSSSAFRLLNVMIGHEAQELRFALSCMAEHGARVKAEAGDLRLNVSYEPKLSQPGADIAPSEVLDVARYAKQAAQADARVRELQRFKLRLLNDVDFQDHEFRLRRSVFGEVFQKEGGK